MHQGRAEALSPWSGDAPAGALAIERCRSVLGPPEGWPEALRTALSLCLESAFPIAIYWGPDALLFYNQAWRPILGDKHPRACGRPGREVWPEVWDTLQPVFDGVLRDGQAVRRDDSLLCMHRHGYLEECYFDYTLNPIRLPDGTVGGVLNIVTETTYRVLGARRARLLQDLAARTGAARSVEDALAYAAQTLLADDAELPFALLWLIHGDDARLGGAAGIDAEAQARVAMVDLADAGDPLAAALARAMRTGQPARMAPPACLGRLTGGPWPEPPREAVMLPVSGPGRGTAVVMLAGISPRRALDDGQMAFLDQLVRQLATALSTAEAFVRERERAVVQAERRRLREALHETETRLRLAVESIDLGNFEWIVDDDVVACTPSVERMFGVAHAVRHPGPALRARIHPEDRDALRQASLRALDPAGTRRMAVECRVRPRDGDARWIDMRGTVTFGGDGRPGRMIGICIDVTDRKTRELALADSARRLREADQRKDEFIAMLSHELRNPLAPLRNALHLLERAALPAPLDAAVEMGQRQVLRMTRLVDDLLEISRVTQGKIVLRREPARLDRVIAHAVESAAPMFDARSQRLLTTLRLRDAPVMIDPLRIGQVLENLLTNAAKYSGTGTTIRLAAEEDDDAVRLVVADEGMGIAPEDLPLLFDLFTQAAVTLDRSAGGLGIGLALVRSLVELHGGSVRADSPGRGLGATFTVVLPRAALRGER